MTLRPKKMQLLRWLPKTVVLTRGPSRGKAIYLTFDDGPHPDHTPALLDLLRAHDARATFFLIGREAERYPRLAERIVAEGHQLGNHSYNHPAFHALSHDQQWEEIVRTERVLTSIDGRTQHRFRPPRGVFSPALALRFACSRRNLAYWSYDSLDYQGRAPTDLAEQLRQRPPSAGEVLLMHDDSDCSRHMLAELLPEWRGMGFTFPPLPAF
ncbi:polysaccharide deacetylase family protein [Dyella soli]|uniref:Polysaccharide deacetylase family protein n=1 Tax=Dyella soli TaxID=522319 RepID=A0A4R0YR47_9GAMM|nr:polysaccharide deacetylase family protein [Dyella soli]TCI10455.1 polysaccharide deacetylase family protein [Dyella soli]